VASVTDEFMAMKAISAPGWNLTKISTGLQETRTIPPVALGQWSSQPTHPKHAPDTYDNTAGKGKT